MGSCLVDPTANHELGITGTDQCVMFILKVALYWHSAGTSVLATWKHEHKWVGPCRFWAGQAGQLRREEGHRGSRRVTVPQKGHTWSKRATSGPIWYWDGHKSILKDHVYNMTTFAFKSDHVVLRRGNNMALFLLSQNIKKPYYGRQDVWPNLHPSTRPTYVLISLHSSIHLMTQLTANKVSVGESFSILVHKVIAWTLNY